MATIERSIDVDRPAAEVWAVLEDVSQIPVYSPSTVAVADAPERLCAVGQRFRQTVVVLGQVAGALGVQRRAQSEAEQVLANVKSHLENPDRRNQQPLP